MIITIYTPDLSNILQTVQFRSSCSCNLQLELKDRFGASQLVEFTNDLQGTLTCFVTFSFSLQIEVPITATVTDPIILRTLIAMTNFAGDLDLSDQVAGRPIAPGSVPVIVTLEGTIDASTQMRYTLFLEVTGIVEATGQLCTGTDLVSFIAGNVPVPIKTVNNKKVQCKEAKTKKVKSKRTKTKKVKRKKAKNKTVKSKKAKTNKAKGKKAKTKKIKSKKAKTKKAKSMKGKGKATKGKGEKKIPEFK